MAELDLVALHEATRRRYLNYALSVITSRALPDVRDGLKPVQRRILYAMYHNLRLLPDGRYRKSAAVVGEVMAKYHPHGDSSIYDAMVRMAQPFSLRHPLVDGQGNFGSMDGDGAAAMRYTEARLTRIAVELLSEIGQETVDFRANYDGQHQEPIVLPAQFPQLLVNGVEGIAVGMATRIPPHNLREIIDGAVLLIDRPDAPMADLLKKVKGPDFPTGGMLLNDEAEIRSLYETGQGSLRLRGTWTTEQKGRKHLAILTSVPYGVVKSDLVERIGKLVEEKKLPQVVDVRDESTDDVRVVLELRGPGDAELALAYLFKHTPLQITWPANLTVLVPTATEGIGEPQRLDLASILRYWLDFRQATVRRRFEYELRRLKEAIHILLGFEKIFDALDEAIRLIRAAEGRRDAADKLMTRFQLDDVQTDAILDLRLYKLARLEIQAIRDELAEKRARVEQIEAILASDQKLWEVVRNELLELKKLYGEPRRTAVGSPELAEVRYDEDAYVVAEKTFVIVTRDGWIKRQGSFTGIEKIRVREGDSVGWLASARTTSTVAFFTDHGMAYALKVGDLPSTSGHGEPVQRHFQFGDGERVIGVVVCDPMALPRVRPEIAARYGEEEPPPPHGVAVTRLGRTLRFAVDAHKEPTTRAGRRYMKVEDGDRVLTVLLSDGSEHACLATELGHALCYPVSQINVMRGAGKGVTAIKLKDEDRVLLFALSTARDEGPSVRTPTGKVEAVRPAAWEGSRADRGGTIIKRGKLVVVDNPVTRYDLLAQADLFGRPPEAADEGEGADE